MSTTLFFESKYSQNETKSVLYEAMDKQLNFISTRLKKFNNECAEYEKKYNMQSDEFINKFESGKLGDDEQWFDWYASFKGRELWKKKYNILRETTCKE